MEPMTKSAKGLKYFLSGLYLLSGASKVVPFSNAIKSELEKGFSQYSTVFPTVPLGFEPDPYVYQVSIGVAELLLAGGFLFGPSKCQQYCCGGLMAIMVGAVQTTLCLKIFDQATIAFVCFTGLAYLFKLLGPFGEEKKSV